MPKRSRLDNTPPAKTIEGNNLREIYDCIRPCAEWIFQFLPPTSIGRTRVKADSSLSGERFRVDQLVAVKQ